jgi:hypothetical protein
MSDVRGLLTGSSTARTCATAYRREEGEWKSSPGHGDNPPRDPSPPPDERAEDSDD